MLGDNEHLFYLTVKFHERRVNPEGPSRKGDGGDTVFGLPLRQSEKEAATRSGELVPLPNFPP